MSLTLGMLSWNAHRTLQNTLETYKLFGLDKLATEKLIFFQELSQEDKHLADKYGYKYIGAPNNIGVAAGYKKLVEHATSDLFLFLENDWVLVEDPTYQIQGAEQFLEKQAVDVVRLRHRRYPGHPLWTLQYQGTELEHPEFLLDSIHWTDPSRFPQVEKRFGFYITTACYANWTNNPTMFRLEWLRENIVPRMGNRDVEVDIQEWWREQIQFSVAQGEGLFTHNRIG